MTEPTARLAFDLLETDLAEPDAIAALALRHAVEPARSVFNDHGLSFALGSFQPLWPADPTPATLEPALRGLALAQELFPGALRATRHGAWDPARPGQDLPSWTLLLALTSDIDLAWVVRSLLGDPGPMPASYSLEGSATHSAGLDELARAKALVEAALLSPRDDDEEMVAREEAGLQAIEVAVSDELDAVLARDVKSRLVRISDVEPVLAEEQIDHPDAPDLYEPLRVERGVFPMILPTTITGLVVHDLVETFRLGRSTGLCAVCRRPFVLESQQASLARRGFPVYHPDCFAENRRRYMRDYRTRRREERVNSTSGLSLSTDAP